MPRVLHLVKSPIPAHALAMIQRQSGEPDTALAVVLLHGADPPPLPAGVTVGRLSDTISYSDLLDLVFSADQVISW